MTDRSQDPYRRLGTSAEWPSPYHERTPWHSMYATSSYKGTDPFAQDQAEPDGDPLKVIHVGQSMVRAGVEQWLKGLLRFLDPKRVRVERCIATATDLIDPQVMATFDVPVEVGQAETVRRAAQECDILLCWGPEALGGWLLDSPPPLCVFVAHGEGIWTRKILAGCAPVVDHVVAVSQRVRGRICNGIPSSVIHNGVDTNHLARSRSRQAVRRELGFDAHDFVLGFVGRLSPEKRAHALIEAVALLPPRFKLLIVGWGAQRAELEHLADAWAPGRCVFVEPPEFIGDYYYGMDALGMVSDAEGFSLVVLEAMFCGLPVIATSVGCVPEVIADRVNGLVVSGTVDSICEAVEQLDRHPDWARGIAAEGRTSAEQTGHARCMSEQYERLFAQLWTSKFGANAKA